MPRSRHNKQASSGVLPLGPSRSPGGRTEVNGQTIPNFALVWVDSAPLRERELKRYQLIQSKFEKLQAEVRRYTEVDHPQFEGWYQSTFEKRLERRKQLETELQKLEAWATAVNELAYTHDMSVTAAYRKIKKANDEMELEYERQRAHAAEKEAEEQESQSQESAEENFDREFESFFRRRYGARPKSAKAQAAYDQLFKELYEDFRTGNFRSSAHQQSPKARVENESADFKTIYRELARALHPDLNPDQSIDKKELWLEVQNAHLKGDLRSLQLIAAGLAFEQRKESGNIGLFDLEELRRNLEKKFNALQRKKKKFQRSTEWNFSTLQKDEVELKRIRSQFADEIDYKLKELEFRHRHLSAFLDKCSRGTHQI